MAVVMLVEAEVKEEGAVGEVESRERRRVRREGTVAAVVMAVVEAAVRAAAAVAVARVAVGRRRR